MLLAIFIIAGLALIAATISVLAIQNIRNSRAVVLSEPAAGAAQSGAEEGIWNIKRNTALPICTSSSSSDSQSLGTTGFWSASSYCKSYAAATFSISANTAYPFYLFDPDHPNDDLDLSAMPDGGYHNLSVTENTGTHNVNIYVTRLDGTPIGVQPVTVSPGGNVVINGLVGPSGSDNRMAVRLVYCETICVAGSETASVTVNTDQGMPTFPTIESLGCAQKGAGDSGTNTCNGGEVYNRQINVTVPQ